MLALYGRHYGSRYLAIADLIPAGSTVLDLGCGPGILHDRYLRPKAVAYNGLDINPRFIDRVKRRGGSGQIWDLTSDRPLPSADSVIMQASLYQFLPDAAPVVRRMLRAAKQQVIVAEPIRNLATCGNPLLAAVARRQANAGLGACARRFDEPTLDAFFTALDVRPRRSFLIPGGREKVYIL